MAALVPFCYGAASFAGPAVETPVRFHGPPCPLRASLDNAARFFSFALPTGFEPMLVKQKREGHRLLAFMLKGGSSGVRTLGLGIKSPLLCQLS